MSRYTLIEETKEVFNVYFWRKMHCLTNMRPGRDWNQSRVPEWSIDIGYCLDRYTNLIEDRR